jgi:lysophospholipase L1-like esterase
MFSRKKILFILVIIFIPIFFLTLVELFVRTLSSSFFDFRTPGADDIVCARPWKNLGFVQSDELMGWKLVPNYRRYLPIVSVKPVKNETNPDYIYTISINSLGYRTWEFSPKKDKDVFRIICVGDSPIFGWGVKFEDTFAVKLKTLLEQKYKDKKFEVLSCSIPGYSSSQGLYLIEDEILPLYDPDLLIVSFGRNDDVLEKYPDRITIKKNVIILKLENLFQHLALYRALEKLLIKNPDQDIKGMSDLEDIGNNIKFNPQTKERIYTDKDLVKRVSYEETTENLSKIAKLIKKRNIPFLFLNTVLSHLYPERHDLLNKFCKENDIDYIDIYTMLEENIEDVKTNPKYKSQVDYYRNYSGDELFNSNDRFYLYFNLSHPNSIGHQLISETIFKKLEEQHLIK